MDFKKDGATFTFKLKHLSIVGVHLEGHVNSSYLLRWGELLRLQWLNHFFENKLTNYYWVVRWQQFEYSEKLQEWDNIPNLEGYVTFAERSIALSCWPISARTSSIALGHKIVDQKNNETLANGICQFIAIDRSTRRPLKIRDHVSIYLPTNHLHCVIPYNAPKGVYLFCYKTEVPHTGCDVNNHLTNTFYILILLEAFREVVSGVKFKSLPSKKHLPIKSFGILYKGECKACDVINIFVWQNLKDDFLFHFLIKFKDRVIAQAEIKFSCTNSNL